MPKHSERQPLAHKARKRFGQNFLVDQNIIHQIVRHVAPKPCDAIVEIGPGQGAITGPLLEANPQLQVIELDRDLIPLLLAQFVKYPNFKIHQSDALAFDFSTLCRSDQLLRVVGNLPYNISTPLILKLMEESNHIRDMHFMLQKEVVDRLVASPGDKNYGRLSIISQYYCRTDHLFDVPPTAFRPAPKVMSAVVKLAPYQTPPVVAENMANFKCLVKTAFQQRRKTLRNCLRQLVSDEQAHQVGLDLSLRAERLSVEDYVNFCNALWGEKEIPKNHEK